YPRLRDSFRLEAFVHRESEHEGKSGRNATAQLRQRLLQALVTHRLVQQRRLVARRGGLLRERGDVVPPLAFRTHAIRCNGLEAVTDPRTGVVLDGVLDDPLVVVDEESRGCEGAGYALAQLVELVCRCNRICRAAAQLTLVIHRRTAGAQVRP